MIKVKAHTCYLGKTGYAVHARSFFRELSKLIEVKIRNFTWDNDPNYLNDNDFSILEEITLSNQDGSHSDYPISYSFPKYPWKKTGNFQPDVNIVLMDIHHPYFYEKYDGFKIAYNVWETTEFPHDFFKQIKQFDQFWVPSEWQRKNAITQGCAEDKVKVVPEGVDPTIFYPSKEKRKDGPFRFLIAGRWEYRKSTKEIIETFCKEFKEDEDVELLLLVDNPFANDGLETTEKRLVHFGLTHKKIKVIHSLSSEEYINLLKSTDAFVSCARGEGWNLPLIEAMSCGIPSIYSNWGAQLEFAKGKGIPVKIVEEKLADNGGKENWINFAPGNLCEPDYEDLSRAMREVYNNLDKFKTIAISESEEIRENFSWEKAAIKAEKILNDISKKHMEWKWITCADRNYLPIIEELARSLMIFSTRKLIVYCVNDEPTLSEDITNVIVKKLEVNSYSKHDKWYWKQLACIESLKEGDNFVWIDGDVIVNHNIDSIERFFKKIDDYPLSDIHYLTEHLYYSHDERGPNIQKFGENLAKKFKVDRFIPFAHVCCFIYNQRCKWWFEEILKIYRDISIEEYSDLNPWNDEGIDNLLRWKYEKKEHLPLLNFDVSPYLGSRLGNYGNSMYFFLNFMDEVRDKNFGDVYGFQHLFKNKENILYFHGNKDPKIANLMTRIIKLRKDGSFHESEIFYVDKYEVKDLGSIKGVEGATMEIANRFGWDYAIYHEIYNLEDYCWKNDNTYLVKVEEGDVVVDLGANLGIFTRYAYQKGASKILSFEPDKRYFECLSKNAHPTTVLFKTAISNKIEKRTFTEAAHLGGSNMLIKDNADLNQYEVLTYTLDHLFEAGYVDKIDFLKVDIEGSEILAFEGISDFNLRKVKKIAMEYHHAHFNHDTKLRNTLIERLNRLGFNSMIVFTATNDLQMIYFWI